MKRFVIEFILFMITSFLVLFIFILIRVKRIDLNNFPGNNVSNSTVFKSKLDHAILNDKLKKCEILISGSSMSLNNISGYTIEKRAHKNVYNFSAWGIKSEQILEFFKSNLIGQKVRYLIVPFNNYDFGNPGFNIDYPSADMYVNGNLSDRAYVFTTTFNINSFISDWKYRNQFANSSNHYESLKFDETGSALLTRDHFEINRNRWKSIFDTTGFEIFYENMVRVKNICKNNNIDLFLVYLPTRSDLLTNQRISQNLGVSRKLKDNFNTGFIDLSTINMGHTNYCDCDHFFKEGAEFISDLIVDSIQLQNKVFVK
jgi:hypothetical protein